MSVLGSVSIRIKHIKNTYQIQKISMKYTKNKYKVENTYKNKE